MTSGSLVVRRSATCLSATWRRAVADDVLHYD